MSVWEKSRLRQVWFREMSEIRSTITRGSRQQDPVFGLFPVATESKLPVDTGEAITSRWSDLALPKQTRMGFDT